MTKTKTEKVLDSPTETEVTCLGMQFANDQARRSYFLEKLREKLQDPDFRKTDGFPIGSDDDILALSDPPYYTGCPNPFIADFVQKYGKPYDSHEIYSSKPFAADVSEGKNDPIYNAHSYHTKVPYKAIMRYILHYTAPGDIVFDGFCGTGMTGIAATICGDAKTVSALQHSAEGKEDGYSYGADNQPLVGYRCAVLSDLSPLASFVAASLNHAGDSRVFQEYAENILRQVSEECGWMFETAHDKTGIKGTINYTIWSDVLLCSDCGGEFVYWEEAVDYENSQVKDGYPCIHCGAAQSRKELERKIETVLDADLGEIIRRPAQVPVLINYSVNRKRFEKVPDEMDLALFRDLELKPVPYDLPMDLMCFKGTDWGDLCRGYHIGTTHVHHFYTKRNRWILAAVFSRIKETPVQVRNLLIAWFTGSQSRLTRLNRYMPDHGRHVGPLSGTYYMSSLPTEISPFYFLDLKLREFAAIQLPTERQVLVSTNSASFTNIPDASVDYIFTDPPFGDNLPYSELNFLWESWLRIYTNNSEEAIVSKTQSKGIPEYTKLMSSCFKEYYRVLKPGRWITVEFHNSRNSVWNAIQEAMGQAGFVVSDVRTLDKKKGTTKQLTYTTGAVKQDLVLTAYKPNDELEERFSAKAGTEGGAWDFVRSHLQQLPVFVSKHGQAEVIAERQGYLLFDRMVAFHVQRGYSVPLSAANFYAGLHQKFPERDGMYFLADQVADYDRERMSTKGVEQLELFVNDEKSAIQWVRRQLTDQPMTYQDLSPLYMREAQRVWEKHERPLELRTILEQNFVEEQNGTWRVPNPEKESDLEQLRHRALMKEFQQYLDAKGKLKVVRTEALRAGFKDCWQKQDYPTIVQMAKRVPEAVVQEDQALLMYYDNALMRTGD